MPASLDGRMLAGLALDTFTERTQTDRASLAAAGGAPGVSAEGAAWLAERGVRAVGADVMAFESIPADGALPGLAAHRILLVDAGINIIEKLALEELAATGAHEFVFLALPLRIVGGTASPIRPLALVEDRRGRA